LVKAVQAAGAAGNEACDLISPLLATGLSLAAALDMILQGCGPDQVQLCLEPLLAPLGRNAALELLDTLARTVPGVAQAGLDRWARNRMLASNCRLAERTWITALPEGFTVEGFLDLDRCESLASLGKGLKVGGDLLLEGCGKLQALPKNLSVGEDLELKGSGVTALPKGLKVGRNLNLEGLRLTKLPDDLAVGHSLFLTSSAIRTLPAGLALQGNLDLSFSRIRTLPAGLKVKESLFLLKCRAWDGRIPADADLGAVFTDRYPGGLPLAAWRLRHPEGESRSRGKA
jgi:hypothetical protein